jgi:hypothetical protein
MNGFRLELFIGNPKNIPNFIQTFSFKNKITKYFFTQFLKEIPFKKNK